MNNYEFCAKFVIDTAKGENISVLDYGCGAGEIVKQLTRKNISAYGCDVFYEGGDYSKNIPVELFGSIIKPMENDRIPFPSSSFDIVINNQVIEHVDNLNFVLSEIQRVLKPGGKVLSLFPDKSVWREGHCGIPFLHWFPKHSQIRVYYALLFRTLGLGHFKQGKSRYQWSRDFCEWLDKWTFYRNYKEISQEYTNYFSDLEHIEDVYIDIRFGNKYFFVPLMPNGIKRVVVRKLGGLVFICSKED